MVPLLRTPLSTAASQAHYSILHLHDQTSLILFNRFVSDPREQYMHALKRIIRYIQGTTDLGLQLYASSPTKLIAYSDADWAGCPTTRRSTSGYCVFLGNILLSWSSKRQPTPSRSSAEAEYRGVANVVAETFAQGQVRVLHVLSRYQFADIFTKGLPFAPFDEFRSSLSVRSTLAPTARGC
ncbi:secreted RxLR effector protein 161-like [Rutidosis leptorrhynchoides]|uniref:secreted RxLR effector protein 161-like n=1 Tax=Rutidosis leptorrhynchoides TaxID=125765 RepID=UPI003A998987